jgi:hypothetical protein
VGELASPDLGGVMRGSSVHFALVSLTIVVLLAGATCMPSAAQDCLGFPAHPRKLLPGLWPGRVNGVQAVGPVCVPLLEDDPHR